MEERLILRQHKKVEKTTNKIRLPKFVIESWGRDFYLELYGDRIVLIPITKKEN